MIWCPSTETKGPVQEQKERNIWEELEKDVEMGLCRSTEENSSVSSSHQLKYGGVVVTNDWEILGGGNKVTRGKEKEKSVNRSVHHSKPNKEQVIRNPSREERKGETPTQEEESLKSRDELLFWYSFNPPAFVSIVRHTALRLMGTSVGAREACSWTHICLPNFNHVLENKNTFSISLRWEYWTAWRACHSPFFLLATASILYHLLLNLQTTIRGKKDSAPIPSITDCPNVEGTDAAHLTLLLDHV